MQWQLLLRTRLLFLPSTLPPLILSGDKPNQDANAEAFRNRDTSVPMSHKMVWAVMALIPGTLVRSTPKMRYSSALRSNDLGHRGKDAHCEGISFTSQNSV